MICPNCLYFLVIYQCVAILARVHDNNKEHVKDAFSSIKHNDNGIHNKDYDHQAVLGSKKIASEYDSLSPEESKRRLRILVTKEGMDANGDDFVERQELVKWLSKSFQQLADEEGAERLVESDLNGDGLVSWTEHLNSNFDSDNNFEDDQDMIHEDKELWKAADLDHDGQLNANEFAAFNSPEEYPHMRDALYLLTMERKDRNKDGVLDFKEFVSDENGSAPEKNTETYIIEKERFEIDYDIDKDGKLAKDEILKWIIPDSQETIEAEATHLIKSCDDNSDGRLSVDEIVSHYDDFVGSEATNFGDNLHTVRDEL